MWRKEYDNSNIAIVHKDVTSCDKGVCGRCACLYLGVRGYLRIVCIVWGEGGWRKESNDVVCKIHKSFSLGGEEKAPKIFF